jgi:hypothetical protein
LIEDWETAADLRRGLPCFAGIIPI